MFTRDGGVIPYGIPVGSPTGNRRQNFGIRRGYIQRAVFPGDSSNVTGGLEYEVVINKVEYRGVIDITSGGGIRNNHVRVRAGVECNLNPFNTENQRDGDQVWCLFVGGDSDIPVIIGGAQHERVADNSDFKAPSKADGEFERYEYNGIEFLTDKEGNYSISVVGLKNPSLPVLIPTNPTAIGTKIKINKDGKVEILAMGTGDLTLQAQGTGKVTVTTDTGDILVDTTSGNVGVSTVAGDITAESSAGNVTAKATLGDLLLEGSQAKLKLSTGRVGMGGPAGEIVDLFDKSLEQLATFLQAIQTEVHTGNLGYPTSPPMNAAAYAAVHTQILALRLLVGLIKGGI